MKRPGWVYVAENNELPGWVKVGYTRKNPGTRAKTLSSAGVPGRWTIRHAAYTGEVIQAEQRLHLALKTMRIEFDRELFRSSVSVVSPILDHIITGIDRDFPLESADFPDELELADLA